MIRAGGLVAPHEGGVPVAVGENRPRAHGRGAGGISPDRDTEVGYD
jgi:hypothetical protein